MAERRLKKGRQGVLRVGTSGYEYKHWREVFYPLELPRKQWFQYYASQFDTVEINNTFYGLPAAKTFEAWRQAAPEGFCYVLKFSRYGSHIKRLLTPEGTIGLFLERASCLGPLLGAILVQLPPRWHVNPERLEAFLDVAPQEYRWAVEFRDASWLSPEIFEILRRRNAALCIHDMIENHPREITADWVYLRFHGVNYSGDYSEEALLDYANYTSACLDRGLDVYAYFNNDIDGCAIFNARDFKRIVLAKRQR
jgi:uncharacterized protein YecE (DUF72 family)